jgi:GAF domain-containing protein
MQPDLGSVFELVRVLDQGVKSEISLQELLERVVQTLTPQARFARVYRLDGDLVVLQTATGSSSEAPLDASTVNIDAVQRLHPSYRKGVWIVPLQSSSNVYGMLEIGAETEQPDYDQVAKQVRLIAYLLTPIFQQTGDQGEVGGDETLSLVQAQYDTSSAIYGSENLVEILKAVHNFAGNFFVNSHLGLLDDPERPGQLHIMAETDAAGTRAANRYVNMDEYPAQEALVALEALNVIDIDDDPFLTDSERVRLGQRGIRSMVIVPLVVSQRLTGLIAFTQNIRVSLSPAKLRALRNLADQMAVVFENRNLLHQTAESLDEVRTLYEINRAVIGAQDVLDILRVLRSQLAQNAKVISHILIVRDVTSQIVDLVSRHQIDDEGEKVIDVSLKAMLGETGIAGFNRYISGHNQVVTFEENLAQSDSANPMLMMSKANGYQSSITLTLRDRNLPVEMIVTLFDQPMIFDERLRRLYEAAADQIAIVIENQRLLREAQTTANQLTRPVRILEALSSLATLPNVIQEEKALLDQGIRIVVNALDVDHGGMLMFNHLLTQGTVVTEYPNQGAVGAVLDMANSSVYESFNANKHAIVRDLSDPEVSPSTRAMMNRLNIKTMVIIPVVIREQVIGSIGLDFYDYRHFSAETIEIGETLVRQISLGLQNIRLLSDTRRRAEQLQRLATFGQAVQSTLEINTILRIMLIESIQIIPVDQMEIMLYDAAKKGLFRVAHYEDGRSGVNMPGELIEQTGVIAEVWEKRELSYTEDRGAQNPEDQLRSLLIAPVRSRGRMLGLIKLGCMRPYAYSDADLAVFQQMVTQIAAAMENAEAYGQSQRLAKNEALINEISAQFQQQIDLEKMLNVTVNRLGAVLGARSARIRLGKLESKNGSSQEKQ